MFETTIISTEMGSFPFGFTGVTARLLHRGGRGGTVVLIRLAPGTVIPEHWHSDADETVYVLDGDFVEGGLIYGPGTFFFGKAGRPHGPHTSSSGATALTHFSATVDLGFNAVDLEFDAIDLPVTERVPEAPNRHGPERQGPSPPGPHRPGRVRPLSSVRMPDRESPNTTKPHDRVRDQITVAEEADRDLKPATILGFDKDGDVKSGNLLGNLFSRDSVEKGTVPNRF
jgi:quercetin dioxygenase-like cupin family protein